MATDNSEKYKIILDNLLEIKPNDPSVYTKIDDKSYFDLFKMFGPKRFNYIYENKEFSLPIIEVNLLQLLNEIENETEIEKIESLLSENGLNLPESTRRLLKNDFKAGIKKISDLVKSTFQKSNFKWKIFLNKVNEINDEINVWTVHLGFMYVSLVINEKAIYAPLFLKEAFIDFINGIPHLRSEGEIKINEKLQFILNNAGFNIEVNFDLSNYSIEQLIKKLHSEWKLFFNIKTNISDFFIKKNIEEIDNQTLEFYPGIVLGMFLPAGGYSRNRMKEIIDKDDIDSIFDINFDKTTYKNFVDKYLYHDSGQILKITPTNYSQDRAIISSLGQHTIIWGPPGTGKSQTIVNMLATILGYQKTALVASQKKAALEVIRNRLGELSDFCLFILTAKDMKRKRFYDPIARYIKMLEHENGSEAITPLNHITKEEKKWVDDLEHYLNNPHYNEVLKAYFYLYANIDQLSRDDVNFLISLPKNIKYPQDQIKPKIEKTLLKINKIFINPFSKKYKNIKKLGKEINNRLGDFKGNLSELVSKFRNINPNDIVWLDDFISKIPNFDEQNISDLDEIKSHVTKWIRKKIKKFIKTNKKEYNDFATLVRIGKMEPYKFVKEYANVIKVIFPIIIATPNADLSKWQKEEFDYAIIDESSQMFIEQGLPILYLAKTKILAGDKMQMSPTNWFGVRTSDDSIFGSVDSVLDYVEALEVHNVLLDKNYRSNYASLMTFSSKYFYKSSLDVVDSASSSDDKQSIEVIQVEGKWEDNKNTLEAQTALKIVQDNLDKYNKIILLAFNAKQKEYLTEEIYKNHKKLEEALHNKSLLLRNIENIQGDEADLVVATVAYDKNAKISSTYVARPGGKNALNVAISRAKEKMIVIKTLNSEDVNLGYNREENSDIWIFKKWLEFLELDSNQRKNFIETQNSQINASIFDTGTFEKSQENDFSFKKEIEKEIKKIIGEREDVKVVRNYSIGTMKIDLATFVDGKIYKCFAFDDFEYYKNYEKYCLFKDNYKFLVVKKYDITYLNLPLWLKKRHEILSYFEPNKINIFKNDLIAIKTEKILTDSKISDIIYSDNEKNKDDLLDNLTKEIELIKQSDK